VFIWAMWSHTAWMPNSSSTTYGVDAYQLDNESTRWSRTALAPTGNFDGVVGPLWTGREIVVPTLSIGCGGCLGRPSAVPAQSPHRPPSGPLGK
jgi:hypothetical protein